MNTVFINSMIKSFDFFDIERALVLKFCNDNNLSLHKSLFLKGYLGEFTPDTSLKKSVDTLGDISLDDLSVAFELLIPTEDRILNGAFFTPSYIVDYIIENLSPKESETVADISCGCGAFLIGAIRYFERKYNLSISVILKNNIYGVDILEYNIRRCKVLICLLGLQQGEILEETDFNLLCCDSLKYGWERSFDCIVGNPPYVKFQDLKEDTRNYLSSVWMTTSFGTYNLYFAFFELGYNLLSNTGRLGYITPNNYFTSLAGENLRVFFQEKSCIYKIVDFNSTKVFDVQAYTAITFLNKERNHSIAYGRLDEGQKPQMFLNEVSFSHNDYDNLFKKKWRLLCGDERYNINQIESVGEPIGQLFNICVGIATLKDDVYSFFPIDEDDEYYFFEKNGTLWKVEKELTRSTVKISEMKSQQDVESNARRFIYPYKSYQGRLSAVPEEEMRQVYPQCYFYFMNVKDILAARGKGKHMYTPFYSYGRTQGLNRKGIKIYTPTFSKAPRFLIDLDKDSLFTNGYGIFFRDKIDNLFECNPITEIANLDVIQKILNSEIMNYYITATSVAIDGGYPCYQKNFIEKFTIPYLKPSQISKIRECQEVDELNSYLAELYHINLPQSKRS